jgi:hypothetical protein
MTSCGPEDTLVGLAVLNHGCMIKTVHDMRQAANGKVDDALRAGALIIDAPVEITTWPRSCL